MELIASSYNDCNWLTLSSPYSFVPPDRSGFTFKLFFARTIFIDKSVLKAVNGNGHHRPPLPSTIYFQLD